MLFRSKSAPIAVAAALYIFTTQPHHISAQSWSSRNGTEPCAQVSSLWAAQSAANATAKVVIDGQLAYDCLTSVPLNTDDAVRLVRSLQPFLDWQTTSSYLRDPPEDYQFPAFDIETAFDEIIDNIRSGQYQNEHEFQTELYLNFLKAKDGHFRFFPDLLTAAIVFRRGDLSLVSVSLDGVSVPEIYALSDIRLYNNDSSFSPSPVRALNGEDPVAAVEAFSVLGGVSQDRDALYNAMFYSPANSAYNYGDWQGFYGGSTRFGYLWPGPSTAVEFENGTIISYKTIARVVGNFSDITDGSSFYAKYCSGSIPVTQVATPPKPTPTSTPTPVSTGDLTALLPFGYPTPVVIASDQSAAGYFLPESDVAVLSLLTFQPESSQEFQETIQTLIDDSKAAGKTKLIVDVSANGGGWIFHGHDTFRLLFPQIQQDGFNRLRSNPLLQIGARQLSGVIPDGFDWATSDNETLANIYENVLNYRFDLDIDNNSFTSVEDKFSPVTFNGDNFTQIIRWDYDQYLYINQVFWENGSNVTGDEGWLNYTQPFAAEDIIILYDGVCASTCTLFSEFMRVQAGVQSVTFGGRPQRDADGKVPIIQNYGGTKGSNNAGYSFFNYVAETSLAIQGDAFSHNTSSSNLLLSQEEIDLLTLNLDSYALNRSTGQALNIRDNIIRDHLEDGLPAQFVYEATDCRLFYTPLSIIEPAEQWRLVAEAAWGDGACVAGSLQKSSGLSRMKSAPTSAEKVKMGKVVSLPYKVPIKSSPWEQALP